MADTVKKTVEVDVKVTGEGKLDNLTQDLNNVDKGLDNVKSSTDNYTKSADKNTQSVLDNGGAMGILNALTGGYAQVVKDAVEASSLFSKETIVGTAIQKTYTWATGAATVATKAFRLALIATGIGAIVVLVLSLVSAVSEYMNQTDEATVAQERFNEALKQSNDLFAQQNKELETSTQLAILRAKRAGASIEELRKIENDAFTEKLKNISEEIKRTEDLLKTDVEDKEAAIKRKIELERQWTDIYNQDLINREKQRLDDYENQKKLDEKAQQERENNGKKLAELSKKEKEEEAKRQFDAWEAGLKAEKEFYDNRKKIAEEFRLEKEEAELDDAYAIAQRDIAAGKERLRIETDLNDKRLAAEEAYKQAKSNVLNSVLSILSAFAGKSKAVALGILAVEKGLAIAEIVTNASKAIGVSTANLASVPAVLPPGVPNPAYPLAVASTVKSITATKVSAGANIAAILATSIQNAKSIAGGGGGGGGVSGGGGAPAPKASFNIVGQSSTNQLAQTIGNQQNQPVQAFVVASEVTSQQSLDRNRQQNATFL